MKRCFLSGYSVSQMVFLSSGLVEALGSDLHCVGLGSDKGHGIHDAFEIVP